MMIDIPYKTKTSSTAIRPLCNLKPHLGAAIRCLEWSHTDVPHTYLLFTGGAIESMRAWQVTLSILNSYQVQQVEDFHGNMVPEQTPLSLGCLERAQCPHVSENLETRIMDLSVFTLPAQPRMHFIAAVYSDAAIRVWLFDEVANSFVLAIDASHHEKCILQVAHVQVEGGIMMLTAATDGKISVWDLTSALDAFLFKYHLRTNKSVQPIRSFPGKNKAKVQKDFAQPLRSPLAELMVHQSGVNSLSARNVGQGIVLTASGGDDNALVVSQIQVSWDSIGRAIKIEAARVIARDSFAHGSAIQGMWRLCGFPSLICLLQVGVH